MKARGFIRAHGFLIQFPVWGRKSISVLLLFLLGVSWTPAQPRIPSPGNADVTKAERYFDVQVLPEDFVAGMTTSNTTITLKMITGQLKPELLAVSVGQGQQLTPENSPVKWVPFVATMKIELGDDDGDRSIFVAARWKASDTGYAATGFDVTVSRSKPPVYITHPASLITFQQVIQVKGYSPKPLMKIEYDVLDESGDKLAEDEAGFITDQYFDQAAFDFTTNYFQCFDVELQRGTNIIALRCWDHGGNLTSTNLVYVFTTEGDTEPPHFLTVGWPRPGATLSGDSLTVRGRVDDYSATLTGQIVANGQTNHITGYPERNGTYWYEEIPLSGGVNWLTLTATDAAGNTSQTNFSVVGTYGPSIILDPIEPAEKLWQSHITATGRVRPASYALWVNGIQAVVKPDGTWIANKVPVISPNGGGVATFDMTATPIGGQVNQTAKHANLVLAQSSLGATPMILNASSPACGAFKLHLSGVAGRSFLLQASTNLTDWTTILTNTTPNPSFNYTDENAQNYPCRFFRVVPLDQE